MNRIYHLFFLLILAFTVMSCSETKRLQKGLAPYQEHLGYEFTSPIAFNPKSDSMVVQFNGIKLDSLTTVKKHHTLILPLIFINFFDYNFKINLGASSLKENYNDFFFDALLDECDRSGKFALSYDSIPSESKFTMEITLDTCETSCIFRETENVICFIYGYMMTYEESVKPIHSKLSGSAILRKGDRIIYKKKLDFYKECEFPGMPNMNRSDLYPALSWCLVHSLNQCTKDCISSIVTEANKAIEKKN